MAKLRLTSDGLVDVNFTGLRLTSGGLVKGSPEAAGGATVALTGTVVSSIIESDITAGGKTIILTLTNDTFVTAGATFDAQRQNIIDGIDSAQSETTGWDAEVKAKLAVTTVVRTSDTVVTITLSAQSGYDITAQETITATVPATALTTSVAAVVASPTFTIDIVSTTNLPPSVFHNANQIIKQGF